jgi:hypothetical protein
MSNLHKLTTPWLSELGTDDIIWLRDHLGWLQSRLFDQYEPNWYETFDDRLGPWLDNVTATEDKQTLFRLLAHLFFIGKAQFDSLSRAAFHDDIARWIIDLEVLDLRSPDLTATMNRRVQNTWFCPITDSMRINSFLKLNNLRGHDFRPDWRSLVQFADPASVRKYVQDQAIQGLVLLEDFVGGGTQMTSSVIWAATQLPQIPILVVPLVCCPKGAREGRKLEQRFANLKFAPVLLIGESQLVGPLATPNEPSIFAQTRVVVRAEQHRLDEWRSDPFGFDHVGALVTLFTNCPDNTLPMIFHSGSSWEALFPRLRRG